MNNKNRNERDNEDCSGHNENQNCDTTKDQDDEQQNSDFNTNQLLSASNLANAFPSKNVNYSQSKGFDGKQVRALIHSLEPRDPLDFNNDQTTSSVVVNFSSGSESDESSEGEGSSGSGQAESVPNGDFDHRDSAEGSTGGCQISHDQTAESEIPPDEEPPPGATSPSGSYSNTVKTNNKTSTKLPIPEPFHSIAEESSEETAGDASTEGVLFNEDSSWHATSEYKDKSWTAMSDELDMSDSQASIALNFDSEESPQNEARDMQTTRIDSFEVHGLRTGLKTSALNEYEESSRVSSYKSNTCCNMSTLKTIVMLVFIVFVVGICVTSFCVLYANPPTNTDSCTSFHCLRGEVADSHTLNSSFPIPNAGKDQNQSSGMELSQPLTKTPENTAMKLEHTNNTRTRWMYHSPKPSVCFDPDQPTDFPLVLWVDSSKLILENLQNANSTGTCSVCHLNGFDHSTYCHPKVQDVTKRFICPSVTFFMATTFRFPELKILPKQEIKDAFESLMAPKFSLVRREPNTEYIFQFTSSLKCSAWLPAQSSTGYITTSNYSLEQTFLLNTTLPIRAEEVPFFGYWTFKAHSRELGDILVRPSKPNSRSSSKKSKKKSEPKGDSEKQESKESAGDSRGIKVATAHSKFAIPRLLECLLFLYLVPGSSGKTDGSEDYCTNYSALWFVLWYFVAVVTILALVLYLSNFLNRPWSFITFKLRKLVRLALLPCIVQNLGVHLLRRPKVMCVPAGVSCVMQVVRPSRSSSSDVQSHSNSSDPVTSGSTLSEGDPKSREASPTSFGHVISSDSHPGNESPSDSECKCKYASTDLSLSTDKEHHTTSDVQSKKSRELESSEDNSSETRILKSESLKETLTSSEVLLDKENLVEETNKLALSNDVTSLCANQALATCEVVPYQESQANRLPPPDDHAPTESPSTLSNDQTFADSAPPSSNDHTSADSAPSSSNDHTSADSAPKVGDVHTPDESALTSTHRSTTCEGVCETDQSGVVVTVHVQTSPLPSSNCGVAYPSEGVLLVDGDMQEITTAPTKNETTSTSADGEAVSNKHTSTPQGTGDCAITLSHTSGEEQLSVLNNSGKDWKRLPSYESEISITNSTGNVCEQSTNSSYMHTSLPMDEQENPPFQAAAGHQYTGDLTVKNKSSPEDSSLSLSVISPGPTLERKLDQKDPSIFNTLPTAANHKESTNLKPSPPEVRPDPSLSSETCLNTPPIPATQLSQKQSSDNTCLEGDLVNTLGISPLTKLPSTGDSIVIADHNIPSRKPPVDQPLSSSTTTVAYVSETSHTETQPNTENLSSSSTCTTTSDNDKLLENMDKLLDHESGQSLDPSLAHTEPLVSASVIDHPTSSTATKDDGESERINLLPNGPPTRKHAITIPTKADPQEDESLPPSKNSVASLISSCAGNGGDESGPRSTPKEARMQEHTRDPPCVSTETVVQQTQLTDQEKGTWTQTSTLPKRGSTRVPLSVEELHSSSPGAQPTGYTSKEECKQDDPLLEGAPTVSSSTASQGSGGSETKKSKLPLLQTTPVQEHTRDPPVILTGGLVQQASDKEETGTPTAGLSQSEFPSGTPSDPPRLQRRDKDESSEAGSDIHSETHSHQECCIEGLPADLVMVKSAGDGQSPPSGGTSTAVSVTEQEKNDLISSQSVPNSNTNLPPNTSQFSAHHQPEPQGKGGGGSETENELSQTIPWQEHTGDPSRKKCQSKECDFPLWPKGGGAEKEREKSLNGDSQPLSEKSKQFVSSPRKPNSCTGPPADSANEHSLKDVEEAGDTLDATGTQSKLKGGRVSGFAAEKSRFGLDTESDKQSFPPVAWSQNIPQTSGVSRQRRPPGTDILQENCKSSIYVQSSVAENASEHSDLTVYPNVSEGVTNHIQEETEEYDHSLTSASAPPPHFHHHAGVSHDHTCVHPHNGHTHSVSNSAGSNLHACSLPGPVLAQQETNLDNPTELVASNNRRYTSQHTGNASGYGNPGSTTDLQDAIIPSIHSNVAGAHGNVNVGGRLSQPEAYHSGGGAYGNGVAGGASVGFAGGGTNPRATSQDSLPVQAANSTTALYAGRGASATSDVGISTPNRPCTHDDSVMSDYDESYCLCGHHVVAQEQGPLSSDGNSAPQCTTASGHAQSNQIVYADVSPVITVSHSLGANHTTFNSLTEGHLPAVMFVEEELSIPVQEVGDFYPPIQEMNDEVVPPLQEDGVVELLCYDDNSAFFVNLHPRYSPWYRGQFRRR